MSHTQIVEVYIALDAVEASAVTNLLQSRGIRALVRDMSISPYPVTFGPLGEKRIAVPADSEDAAREILSRAIGDGYLRAEGIIVPKT